MKGDHECLYIKGLLFLHLSAGRTDWAGFKTPQKSGNVIIMGSDGFYRLKAIFDNNSCTSYSHSTDQGSDKQPGRQNRQWFIVMLLPVNRGRQRSGLAPAAKMILRCVCFFSSSPVSGSHTRTPLLRCSHTYLCVQTVGLTSDSPGDKLASVNRRRAAKRKRYSLHFFFFL